LAWIRATGFSISAPANSALHRTSARRLIGLLARLSRGPKPVNPRPLDRRTEMLELSAKSAVALSIVVAACSAATSCERRVFLAKGEVVSGTPRPAQPQGSRDLVGAWTSDTNDTQLGAAVFTICFSADGNFRSTTNTQAGPIENHGSYRVAGDTVTFTSWENVKVAATVRWHGDRLLITEAEQGTMSYRRTALAC
jgi:hypothetical protein